MVFPSTVRPIILVYEFLRLLVVCTAQVGRPTAVLPASWYAAAPLLALPLVLQLLCRLSPDRIYGRLYVLTKGLSALGCLAFTARTLSAAFSGTNAVNRFALRTSLSFALFAFFFLVDVILIVMEIRHASFD